MYLIEIYLDTDGWHWVMWSPNGDPIARSASAFKRSNDCMRSAQVVAHEMPGAQIVKAAG